MLVGFSLWDDRHLSVHMPRGSALVGVWVSCGRTFGMQSATTGSLAVRSVQGRWPAPRRRCYRPDRRWPANGPRKTLTQCACSLVHTQSFELWGLLSVPANRDCMTGECLHVRLVSVANRSVTCLTRLETRTKESNMCASHWACTKPKGTMKVKASRLVGLGRIRAWHRRMAHYRPVSTVASVRRR